MSNFTINHNNGKNSTCITISDFKINHLFITVLMLVKILCLTIFILLNNKYWISAKEFNKDSITGNKHFNESTIRNDIDFPIPLSVALGISYFIKHNQTIGVRAGGGRSLSVILINNFNENTQKAVGEYLRLEIFYKYIRNKNIEFDTGIRSALIIYGVPGGEGGGLNSGIFFQPMFGFSNFKIGPNILVGSDLALKSFHLYFNPFSLRVSFNPF